MATYKQAGVDISAGNEVTARIKSLLKSPQSPTVLNAIGGFGALLDLKPLLRDYHDPILVQSIDGLGTKPIIARLMNDYSSLGQDLLSATANDILVLGARPLWLLDYIANDKLSPERIEIILSGLIAACRKHDVALVGGETAEMPDIYQTDEIDIAGIITGVVERENIIDGKKIAPGDKVFGVASNGLHTNGYSLARHVLLKEANYQLDTYFDVLGETLGEALLKPHLNYTPLIHGLLGESIEIHGLSHITGGGLMDNFPRVLPKGVAAEIKLKQIPSIPLFDLLCHEAKLSQHEAYTTFNMGVGFVIVVSEASANQLECAARAYPDFTLFPLGQIIPGQQTVQLI